jgi:hypothetical protein
VGVAGAVVVLLLVQVRVLLLLLVWVLWLRCVLLLVLAELAIGMRGDLGQAMRRIHPVAAARALLSPAWWES